MLRERLTPSEIDQALQALAGWQLAEDGLSISRTYRFGNFVEAFAFMTRSAFAAEKLDHHPEWFNVYRTVEVKLTTHSAKGVTELDIALAEHMDKAAGH